MIVKTISISMLVFGLICCTSIYQAQASSETHVQVGIQYIEPTKTKDGELLKNLQKTVVEIDGVVDILPTVSYEIPATNPKGGGTIRQFFCVQTMEATRMFKATVYAVNSSGQSSPRVFAESMHEPGQRKFCGSSAMMPLSPDNFRALSP